MDENPQLRIEHQADRLVIDGEVDMNSAPQLRAALEEHFPGSRAVTLDLAGVTFMDSSGLRVLIELHQRVDTVTLVDPTSAVDRLFELASVTELFAIVRS